MQLTAVSNPTSEDLNRFNGQQVVMWHGSEWFTVPDYGTFLTCNQPLGVIGQLGGFQRNVYFVSAITTQRYFLDFLEVQKVQLLQQLLLPNVIVELISAIGREELEDALIPRICPAELFPIAPVAMEIRASSALAELPAVLHLPATNVWTSIASRLGAIAAQVFSAIDS